MMIHCSWEASVLFGTSKMHLSATVAKAPVHSKAVVVLLLLIHCQLLLSLFIGFLWLVNVSLCST